MHARIINVRHGAPEFGHQDTIYATLINADNGVVYLYATLEFILKRVNDCNYILVGDKNVGE